MEWLSNVYVVFAAIAAVLIVPLFVKVVRLAGSVSRRSVQFSTGTAEMSEIAMAGRSSDPTDNLKKRPPKGILKTSSSFEVEDGPSVSRKDKPKHKGTKWDEMNIIETLHPLGKDYGHMKIEEPKTPFERTVQECDESDGVDAAALAYKLEESSSTPLKSLTRLEESDSEEELTPEQRGTPPIDEDVQDHEPIDFISQRKKAFESKRKAHYNEFLAAKKAMTELKDEDDEDDDDSPPPPPPPPPPKAPASIDSPKKDAKTTRN